MKSLLTSKLFLSLVGIGAISAGVFHDYNAQQKLRNELINADEVVLESEAKPVKALLNEKNLNNIALYDMPVTPMNKLMINGTWTLNRVLKNSNEVDMKNQPVKLNLKLINRSEVMVNGDTNKIFKISLFSKFETSFTLAIFKKGVDGTFDLLEISKEIERNNGMTKIEDKKELVLERAVNPDKGNVLLTRNDVSGSLSLEGNLITEFAVEIKNPNGQTQSLKIERAELMDGGAFVADIGGEEVSGLMINAGDSYRITFSTGPLAKAMLNFVSNDQYNKLLNEEISSDSNVERNAERSAEEVAQNQSAVEASEQVLAERRNVASVEAISKAAAENNLEVLSKEEVDEIASQKGISF